MLSGTEATELYLQSYQLILWKQCFWLVNEKGFPKELETVVRDLWGLRLGLLHVDQHQLQTEGDLGASSAGFSSTSEGENTDSDGKSMISTRSRRSEVGKDNLPKLIETLGLCYLATLLMRLPTSLGEFCKWAAQEEMIYTRAVSCEYSGAILLFGTTIVAYENTDQCYRSRRFQETCGLDYLVLSFQLWRFESR